MSRGSAESGKKGACSFSVLPLSDDQRAQLERQQNRAEDWATVRVSSVFDPACVHGCQFGGAVDIDLPLSLEGSTITDCRLARGVTVTNSRIERYDLDSGATVVDSSLVCKDGCRVSQLVISAVPESGERPVSLSVSRSFKSYVDGHYLDRPARAADNETADSHAPSRGYLGNGARVIDGAVIIDSWIGDGANISGGAQINNAYLASRSAAKEAITVDSQALISASILNAGVSVSSHSFVEYCHIFEHTSVSHHALVSHSIISTNCRFERGEIRASIIGPFVNLHHNSMLISVFWPDGRGNIGSGALFGANHTTRMAKQECRLAEGFWAGLRSSAIMPLNLTRAPYLTIASMVTLRPQRIAMPFSLIVPGSAEGGRAAAASASAQETVAGRRGGLNRILPAWAIYRNMYALLRSWHKYRDRDCTPQYRYQHCPFRSDLLDSVVEAVGVLQRGMQQHGEREYYTAEHIPELGECYLLQRDLIEARQGYQQYITITHHFLDHGKFPDELFTLATIGLSQDATIVTNVFDADAAAQVDATIGEEDNDSVIEYFRQRFS